MRIKPILNTEIKLQFSKNRIRLPAINPTWVSVACLGVFIISPFAVSILCIIHHSIDYTIYTHPRIIQEITWPIAALAGIIAIIIEYYHVKQNSVIVQSWLKANPVYFIFLLQAIWMIIATTVNGWNAYVVYGAGLRFETIYMQLGYFLLLFPVASFVRKYDNKQWLIRIHEVVSLFLVPTAFFLWKTQVKSLFFQWSPSFTCIYSNINYYGYYLSVSVPLSAEMFVAERNPNWKTFSLLTMICNTVALAYNNTMGAWVACLFSMVFLLVAHGLIEKSINLEVAFAAAVFFVSLYIPSHHLGYFEKNFAMLFSDISKVSIQAEGSNSAGSGRWIIWKRGLKLISENPVFGIGFEGIDARNLKQYAKNNRIHNEYLQYALFYGMPAGILYLTGIVGVYIRALKRRYDLTPQSLVCLAGAFGYLGSAFFGITLFCTTPFLFIYLGMGYETDNIDTVELQT